MDQRPNPVAVRPKDYIWSSLIPGFAGSRPANGIGIRLLCFVCCVGGSFCNGLMAPLEEFYRARARVCVCVCVCVCVRL
jgi:hypothetical protein